MDDNQKQIILGGLLGNSYICQGRKNNYLCIRHSINNLTWLQHKASELTLYGAPTPWHTSGTTCTWRSISHPIFTELRKFCYFNNKKTVNMEWLNTLRDIAISIWYGDSGTLMGRNQKNACLRTQAFGLEGNQIIEKYFNEVDLPCNMNKSRNSYIIVFTVPGTEKLLKMVASNLLPAQSRYSKLITTELTQ